MVNFNRKIVSLPYIIYMSMRRNLVISILFSLAILAPINVMATSPNVRDKIEEASSMLDAKRWYDAKQILLEVAEELDAMVDAEDVAWVDYQLTRCSVELGSSNAEAAMRGYIEEYPMSEYANNMQLQLANYYFNRAMLGETEVELQRVKYKGLESDDRERYDIFMAYILFSRADYAAAKEYCENIKQGSVYYPHAQYIIAYGDYQAGRYAEAKPRLQTLLEYEVYADVVPYYLLQIELRDANYDYVIEEGLKLMNGAVGTTRDDLVRALAESYFAKGDYSQAIRYIVEYPAEKMGRQENYLHGYSLYRLARYNDAIAPLRRVCGAQDALTQNASYHLGDCYIRVNDRSNAADAFAMAAVDGFDADMARDAMLNYGRLKYELGGGTFNEAINILHDYLCRYPNSPHEEEVKALLVAAYYNSKNYKAAYEALHELNPRDKELLAALQRVALYCAIEAIEAGDLIKAKELLKEAEEIGLTSKYTALALYWQGEVAYAMGNMEQAKERYNSYIRRAPKSEKEYYYAHYGVGYANFTLGNMKDAATLFESFVRNYKGRDSYLYDAQNRLGDSRYSLREFSEARKAYNVVASSTTVERNYARYQLALVDGIEANTKGKIDRLKAIVSDGEGDYVDDAWYELGRTYITSERYADGAATLQEFVNADKHSPYYITALSDLGLAYYNLNRKSDARRCYEEVVAFDPQSEAALEAMRGIREIYVSEGNIDAYFEYANRCGVQSDMSAAARDSLTFATAKNLYLDDNIASARIKLDDYLKSFNPGYYRSEALFYLSDCQMREGDNRAAIETMSELLGQGQTLYTERVLRVMAPLCYDEGEYRRSAEAYRKLYDVCGDSSIRGIASEGYVDATLKYGNDAEVRAMADDVERMADATMWAKNRSQLMKAHSLRTAGESAKALVIYESLAANRKSEEGAEAYYYLIDAKYAEGNYAGVEQMVYNLGECGSMYWQAKAFLLLGDALVKQNNTFQARATYQSIVDGYSPKNDGIVAEAKQRIAKLK